jgi:hypothetical protein
MRARLEQGRDVQAKANEQLRGASPMGTRTPTLLRAALACVAILAVGAGCKRERPAAAPGDSQPTAASSAPAAAPIDDRGRSTKYFTKDEVYGELEGPRLQFMWAASGEPKDSIWSMKTDGTDMRRAAGPELLYSGEAKFLQELTPVRSPDGRYIACVGSVHGDDLRFLVDLKEKKVRTMVKGGGKALFAWTPDSKQVLFYTDMDLYQYTVESGKLEKLPMIYSKRLVIIDGGKRILALRSDAIEYLDRRGKKLKRIMLPERMRSNPMTGGTGEDNFISLDGRTFALALDGNSRRVVVAIDSLEKPLYEDDDWCFQEAFGPDGKTLYSMVATVTALDLASGRTSQIAQLPEHGAAGLTVFEIRRPR